jgi:[acyl-carrier-protein] S-malonyltransferase
MTTNVVGPRIGLLFPARDAGRGGMGLDIARHSPAARALLEQASAVLGFDVAACCRDGGDEELKNGPRAMVCIMAVSLACYRALRERGWDGVAAAGFSQGEFTALAATDALAVADALPLVYQLEGLVQRVPGLDEGRMARIMGLDVAEVEAACREAAAATGQHVAVAIYISDDQCLISGQASAVEAARRAAKQRGADLAFALPALGAFHSPLLASAAAQSAPLLARLDFHDARLPLAQCATGRLAQAASAVQSAVGAQLSSPVRWREVVRCLLGLGVDVLVELGPGQTVSANTRLVAPHVPRLHVEDGQSLDEACLGLESLAAERRAAAGAAPAAETPAGGAPAGGKGGMGR